MLKEAILKLGAELTLPNGRTVALQTVQSNKDNPLYLIKTENKTDTVITEFSDKEVILSNTFETNLTKLKVIGKEDIIYDQSTQVVIKYLLNEVNNIQEQVKGDIYFNLDDVEEDEEFDEADAEDQELYEDEEFEENDNFEEESDIQDIANDLWEECANEFGEDKNKFLGKKRQNK
jgi:hypothetical protein